MTPANQFFYILFSFLLLIPSLGSGNEHQENNCPRSFTCGNLGSFQYPFTKAELPHCGLLPIYDCDNAASYPKKIQLGRNHGNRSFQLNGIVQPNKAITIFDDDFHTSLEQNHCAALNKSYSLPPASPLVSFYIVFNVSLFRCNHNHQIRRPPNYAVVNCFGYDIFYDKNSTNPTKEDASTTFSGCSTVQFASKDITNTSEILSFVSAEMVVEVVLSHECDECYNRRGGQCRLGTDKKVYCDEVPKDKSRALKLGIGIGSGIILLGILLTGCYFTRRYRRKHASSDLHYQSKSTNTDVDDPYAKPHPEIGKDYFGIPLFPYKELKEATNDFYHTTQLGSGGFGTVYYGKLRDGREVAVKRLYEHNYRRVEQFTNEIKILTRMRHRNLVSLYGCTSPQSRELLLVYEFIPNGTVASHLHGDLAKIATLPWHTRIKIAIETATALAYLHACDIIHRDVKTNNILVDSNYTVKVADFGLSRPFPNDVTHVSTAPQGTPGYVDPEYYRCYQLTSKSDVYSFGVVLIEIISSKPAVDMNRHKDEINLSDLAIKKIQKGELNELVDPSLGFDSDKEVKRMIVSVAELAFRCLQRDREFRPSMDEVLKELVTIESGRNDKPGGDGAEADMYAPPSPDLDEIGLLKNNLLSPSPKGVTDSWSSESTMPNASG